MEEGKIELQQAVAEIKNYIEVEDLFSIDDIEQAFNVGKQSEIELNDYLNACKYSNKMYHSLKYD